MTIVASTVAGWSGPGPVRGGVTGLLAVSVVAGYWQLDASVAGGLNGGRALGRLSGAPVAPG